MNLDSKKLKIVIGALIGLGVVVYFSQSMLEKKEQAGRSALYQIQKTQEEETKALSEVERATGTDLDVDAKYPKTVAELKKMIQGKSGTDHTLYEASFRLGNLYFEHNQTKPAQDAFEQASKFASGGFQKASAYLMIGATHERAQQFKEAIASYTDGMAKNFDGLKPEFLIGLVRNHVKLNEKDKAKLFAEKLNQEFAGSRTALEAQEMVK